MYRLIYVSSAADTLTADDLQAIVATAQRNNAAREITGVLLFNGLNFLQVLEGPRRQVEQLYTQITMDRRHVSVGKVLDEAMEERLFSKWPMAHRLEETKHLPGAVASADLSDVLDREMPANVKRVINNFVSLKGL